jgi:uncharacterized metal-binding protein
MPLLLLCGWQSALACSIGALAGIILTPDLDVDRGSRSNHYVRKFAGVVVETLWRLYWKPYALLVKHRSIWSHGPILSTAIRLAYLAVLPAILWWWAGLPVPRLETWMLWVILGLVAADSVHALLDWFDSKLGGLL